ncbi:Nramp family divalent metal transporter [Verrucomicrobiales bacterium BCK34]|nr:Nramp family divalent metal transporter [Verrucomicrobiales bacterium BCK34]
MNRKSTGARFSLLTFIGPGLMLAATGVGAGDLAGGAFAGMNLGVAVLWAIVLGAMFKYVITEGLARWQLATETTLLEGAVLRLGPAIRWGFLVYLLLWSFVVGTALIGACGVAMHALFPVFKEASTAKIVFGSLHSLLGLALVWMGTFRFLERIMAVLVSVMIIVVLATGAFIGTDWGAVLRGLTIPAIPDHPEGVAWTLALMGGVGGTLTVLSYGYWIREKNRTGPDDLRLCRWDIGIAYFLMALFGIAMVILSDGLQLSGKGATLIVDLAHRIGEQTNASVELLFLAGAWAAVFSSLLGVWQAVPYLFADFLHLQSHRESLSPDRFIPWQVDTRGKAYRGYLLGLALIPLPGLAYDFQIVQKAYSVFGALVMPMVALTLLLLNGRSDWVGRALRNRWWTSLTLVIILLFFAWIGLPKLLTTLGFGV